MNLYLILGNYYIDVNFILSNILYFSNEIDMFYNNIELEILMIGFISSFVTGILACKLMIKVVANNNLIYFSFYCFILGLLSILII